jgi:hypothetical protein
MYTSTRSVIMVVSFVIAASAVIGGQGRSPHPAIDLSERPAFPLRAHVESADIAAGRYAFSRMFEIGRLLFHATFNGLDGVGVAVRPPMAVASRA